MASPRVVAAAAPKRVRDALDVKPLLPEDLGSRTTLIGLLLAALLVYVSVVYFDLIVTLRLLGDNLGSRPGQEGGSWSRRRGQLVGRHTPVSAVGDDATEPCSC
jgi:hypothetical protein